jgi:hypothetical protein
MASEGAALAPKLAAMELAAPAKNALSATPAPT